MPPTSFPVPCFSAEEQEEEEDLLFFSFFDEEEEESLFKDLPREELLW